MQKKNTVLDVIRIYLPLTIAVIGAAVTWGAFTTRLSANEQRITNIETRQDKFNDTVLNMAVDLSQVKTDVSFLVKQYK